MNIQEFILDEMVQKLMGEVLREIDPKLNEMIGNIAFKILEETDEERKERLTKEYNTLKKLIDGKFDEIDLGIFGSESIRLVRKTLSDKIKSNNHGLLKGIEKLKIQM